MVRLKDSYLYFVLNYVHISIPYGAIKSKIKIILAKEGLKFQFLMVRLKEK